MTVLDFRCAYLLQLSLMFVHHIHTAPYIWNSLPKVDLNCQSQADKTLMRAMRLYNFHVKWNWHLKKQQFLCGPFYLLCVDCETKETLWSFAHQNANAQTFIRKKFITGRCHWLVQQTKSSQIPVWVVTRWQIHSLPLSLIHSWCGH